MSQTLIPTTAPPSKDELEARLTRVRSLMKEKGLELYISFDPVNVYYLTHFANVVHERPFLLVIERDGPPVMVVPRLEISHVQTRARIELQVSPYPEYPAVDGQCWFDALARHVPGEANVGIESAMPVGIAAKVPGRHVVADIIDEVRLVKSRYEIARTAHACFILNEGHRKILEIARPGTPEVLLWSETAKTMTGLVMKDIPDANLIVTRFLAAVWPPSISHDPHLIPKPLTMMEDGGPHVSIVAGQVDGFGVEVERTFFLGHAPEAAQRPFEVMMTARAKAYDMARPGVVLSSIDQEVQRIISRAGYGDNILHRTGHGLGITGHEAPFLALGDDRRLVDGMVVSIEPGIYIPGIGGFRHSDTVWITESGPVKLTQAPESLEELTLAA